MHHRPGVWMERFADRTFSRRTTGRVFRPIIADMQHEYGDALARHEGGEATGILVRGRAAFFATVITYVATRRYHLLSRGSPMRAGMRPLTLMGALGVLGSALVIGSATWFTSGRYIVVPYARLVVGTGAVLRSSRVESFSDRFAIGLGAFMIVTVAHYLYMTLVEIPRFTHHYPPISLFGHAWRLGFMLAIGIALNAALAVVSAAPRDGAALAAGR